MHTDTPDTRTQFLATPQFGFAHLRESRMRNEPNHDFLVVQFGAAAETDLTPRAGRRFAASHRRGRNQP
jgi:hypothetical protein